MSDAASSWEVAFGAPVDAAVALATHLRAREVLRRIVGALEAEQIPALVVKGALLAHVLYDSPVLRPIRDIDLRVRPRDLGKARRVLHAAGIARTLRASHVVGRDAVLLANGIDVDMETTVGPAFMCALTVDAMLARAVRSTEPLGFPHLQPDLYDHAILLVLNVWKDHVLDARPWALRDLVLLARLPAFDTRALAERAREEGASTVVHVVASYLAGHDGGAPWKRVADILVPARPGYARAMLRWLARGESASHRRRMIMRACADSRSRAAVAVAAMLIYATERDLKHAANTLVLRVSR